MLNRRCFITLVGATALVAGLPRGSEAAETVVKPQEDVVEFGYSTDGEFWEMGFPTRAAAIDAAQKLYESGNIQVAEVGFIPLTYPDRLAETVMQGTIYNGGVPAQVVIDDLVAFNEDADFEGDFESECNVAPIGDMNQKIQTAMADAFRRVGLHEYARLVETGDDLPETGLSNEIYEKLTEDTELNNTLEKILREWIEENNISSSLRGVWVKNKENMELKGIPQNPFLADIDSETLNLS